MDESFIPEFRDHHDEDDGPILDRRRRGASVPFAYDPRRWTLDEFRSYLQTLPRPAWIKGLTLHHTYIPNETQWRGLTTLGGLRNYYANDLGWGAGPNLFLAADTNYDGVFQLTPLTTPGIHAGLCNSTHIGIEIVGYFDDRPWSPAQADMIYGVVIALLKWTRLPVTSSTVKGHRECLANKSCPGKAINLDAVRAELLRRMQSPAVPSGAVLPWGTHPVDPKFLGAHSASGGVYRGRGLLSPGYAIAPAFTRGGVWFQTFERGVARLNPDGSVDWLLLRECLEGDYLP